jgi:hypothetical protein
MVKLFDVSTLTKKTGIRNTLKMPKTGINPATARTQTRNLTSTGIPLKLRFAAAGFIIVLIIICGTFSYPPVDVVSGFEEGTTEEELEACLWAEEQVEVEATVASDHRMSSMMFGFAQINSSWEYAPRTLHSESFAEIQSEISRVSIPAGEKRIDYVLITDTIKSGVALKQWEPARPMSDKAIKKFESPPFIKLYDSGSTQLYYIDF